MCTVKAKDRKINIRQHQVHCDILKSLPIQDSLPIINYLPIISLEWKKYSSILYGS